MASALQNLASHSRMAYRSAIASFARSFSTEDALVEIKPGQVGLVSGIPEEHLRRKVLIYSPARTASQQGSGKVGKWKINFMSTQKWENPLMGWTSTGDPYANVGDSALCFDSEEAIAFAKKHGWDYTVKKRQTPLLKTVRPSHTLTTSNGRAHPRRTDLFLSFLPFKLVEAERGPKEAFLNISIHWFLRSYIAPCCTKLSLGPVFFLTLHCRTKFSHIQGLRSILS